MAYQMSYDANVGISPFAAGTSSGLVISSTAGRAREGTYSFRLRNPNYFQTHFITPTTSPAISVWIYFDDPWFYDPTYTRVLEIALVTTTGHRISAFWNRPTKTFDIYVDGSLVKSGDADAVIDAGLLNVRIYGNIADSGNLTVNVNGYEIAIFTGDTLPNGSAAEIAYVEFKTTSTQSGVDLAFFSCISLNDGGLDPGDRRVYVRMVNSDESIQWTRSTGAVSWSLLNNVPPVDTTYVQSVTTGQIDTLGLVDVSGLGTIQAVVKFARALKTTGDAQTLLNGVESGATVHTTENVLSTVLAYHYDIMPVDPATTVAWDMAGINALKAYHESVIP